MVNLAIESLDTNHFARDVGGGVYNTYGTEEFARLVMIVADAVTLLCSPAGWGTWCKNEGGDMVADGSE